MPSIGREIVTHLRGVAAVAAMVGSGPDARIWRDMPRQKAKLPFIVLTIFDGTSHEDLSGASGMATNRVQIDCYGTTEDEAWQLSEAVRIGPPKLQGHRGKIGSTFIHGVESDSTARVGSDKPQDGSAIVRYWASRDFIVTYTEAVPV